MGAARAAAPLVTAGTAVAGLGCALALVNRLGIRRLRPDTAPVIEPVVVVVPARNEAPRLPALIADLRAQQGVSRLRVWILDDGSTDGTFRAAVAAIGEDDRFSVISTDLSPAPGWTGKTAACARLAEIAGVTTDSAHPPPGALIFLDADVRLRPRAVAAAVSELRRSGAGLVTPWPWQRAGSLAEAVVQPLLCWSWATTLPVRLADRSLRPSTAVSCGQFLVFDAMVYRAVGGHAAVAGAITEDLALARALRRAGHRTTLVAAGELASTRMYRGAAELDEGYSRWLWSAYGSTAGALAVDAVAALGHVLPALAAALGTGRLRRTGALGYTLGVVGRLLARSLESGTGPRGGDLAAALAHPVSIGAYLCLSARSRRAHRRGTLTWKGRPVVRAPR
ncbi:putative glycosyl transferase [Nocardia nova SH22a]|uniref:Putative glycosyl transferase n=1 Tax=Nocardia nova SH22a TaxID=1415166 RepID=W5TDR6_9NOCA|nr:glycosyltransferase family 2 protein [Nocardia nova]AHH17148.1 putative glycosyl transferase [Nocardia nova SH22a]